MSSVMHYLMDTLPMAALGHKLATRRNHKDRERAFMDASAGELRLDLEFVPPRISKQMAPFSAQIARSEYDKGNLPRIWAFESGAFPDRVGLGAVRVKEMDLAAHVVFESILWGRPVGSDRLAPEVQVRTEGGKLLGLPLEDRFMYSQWWIRFPIELPEGAVPLFPLKNPLNVGLVRSFLYHQTADGEVKPLDRAGISFEERDEWEETDAAMRQLELGSAMDDPHLGRKLFRHRVLGGPASAGLTGAIGDERDVRVRGIGHRFLVTISLFLGRDIYDFEPSGALDAARIYPHLHFVSTMSCQSVEAACHVKRPKNTRVLKDLGREVRKGETEVEHCGCPDMHTEVRNLLAADANDDDLLVYDLPVDVSPGIVPILRNWNPAPHWGNLFAYYCVDASERFPGRAFEMVAVRNAELRSEYLCVTREKPHVSAPLVERDKIAFRRMRTTKVARQGEFDNCHLAPRMYLRATHAKLDEPGSADLGRDWLKVDPEEFGLNEIAMAPLCAHDCFHTHWRWGDSFTKSCVYGWDEEGPHRAAGAPMVPISHDLRVMLPGRNEIIYSEAAHQIIPGRQEVFFHFGAAYGLAADGIRWSAMPPPSVGTNKGAPWVFGLEVNGVINKVPNDSWSAMYWNYRYFLKEGPIPYKTIALEEYHTVHDLVRAMES